MTTPKPDLRDPQRRARDEEIESQQPLPPLDLPAEAATSTVEAHLAPRPRPLAVAGVVENGLVRPLDPEVRLPEDSRVIIVAAKQ